MDHVELLSYAHEEVVWFDVSMQKAFGMHILYSTQHLVGKHQNGLQVKSAVAEIEEVFQRWAEKIDHHHIVVSFNPIPKDFW
mmetsp:Transcript_11127/g.37813  ORF Transcript_11127/g.37813 Transcript_11127/m.37813 type:complete len:82 (+) Transcript_11127:2595-2840(+)